MMPNRNYRKNGNIAVVEFDKHIKIAHSKINYKNSKGYDEFKGHKEDIILLQKNSNCKTLGVGEMVDGKISKSDRHQDSEAKIFEYMRGIKYDKKREFEFTILSERNMCESCRGVMQQFQNEFPNAKINVVSGKIVKKHKIKADGSIKEVEVSPWNWRKI